MNNPKIEMIWNSTVEEAYGSERGQLGGIKLRSSVSGEEWDLQVLGLFFAICYEPATRFLSGKIELDDKGYIVTRVGSTETSVRGVFAAGDVDETKP